MNLDIIHQMMETLGAHTKSLNEDLPKALAAPDLTLPQAEIILSICVQSLSSIDHLYGAVEQAEEHESIDDDLSEAASDFADACHELVMGLQSQAFEKVRSLGGNANKLLNDLQEKHYSD